MMHRQIKYYNQNCNKLEPTIMKSLIFSDFFIYQKPAIISRQKEELSEL